MDETTPARRSSGIYDHIDYPPSEHSVVPDSASLTGHAATPAGFRFNDAPGMARSTPAGIVPATSAVGLTEHAEQSAFPVQPNQPQPVQPSQPFYKKRWFIISQIILIPLAIVLLFILLFPVVRAIVQSVVKKSTLDIQVASITSPQNGSFQLSLQGNVAHTGIISATIEFTEPVNVSWVESETTETHLGQMHLDKLFAKHKRANIDQITTFFIDDQDAFGRFAASMITSENFTWHMKSTNLRVQAVKFPVAKGISFDKRLNLKGFNNFANSASLKDLRLPSDNPAGGINFEATTELFNPSPFSLDLGTIVFALTYKDVPLGLGTGTNAKIAPGPNNITLSGVLERQTIPTALSTVSELFTNYLNGDGSQVFAKGVSTTQNDNTSISWLSQGLAALNLMVLFKAPEPIQPIRTITIGDLALRFDQQAPWNPSAESHSVHATLHLPFGFGLSIGQIQNDFNISKDGSAVAGLSTPLGASQSSVAINGPTDTDGTINITITNTRLDCPDSQHPIFSSFNANLTSMEKAEFSLVGRSQAIANTSLGEITLNAIKVNVSTSLDGLQGLRGFTEIKAVDVVGGSPDAINLAINVSIFNPSNLNLATGDLRLQLLRDGVNLGNAVLSNLTLNTGNNSLVALSTFEANSSPQGQQTLNEFVGKKDVQLSIIGYDGSTNIPSLAEAFKTLNINVTLPGLKTDLVQTAALTVLPTTGRQNNISHVQVNLFNPFSSPLQITKIISTVKSHSLSLGTIDAVTNFKTMPKMQTNSPTLDLNMNFDPSTLFTLTRALAVEAGLDVNPLDSIVKLGGIRYLSVASGQQSLVSPRDNIFTGFDLPKFVQTAFKTLRSDVTLSADVTIGEYKTTLQYEQDGVPTKTDNTLDLILPLLAQPIVQKIVSGSSLEISSVLISDPKQDSFNTRLKGSINNAGPFDAVIRFPSGLTVSWNGKAIGSIKMGDIKVVGDVGGVIDTQSTFSVADVPHLTDFTKTLLTAESFEWEISGENLTVSALGISVPGISLASKKVSLKGFNGLKDGVQINTFDLPSNDPAGGIHLTLQASAANPSQVGIELQSIGFETFADNVMIAPVSSTGKITLAPQSTSELSLTGRLVPQSSSEGLSAVSDVFNNFLHGKDSDIVVHGASAGPSDVTWLNQGIKVLAVSTVLPNRGPLNVIKSIGLNQLQLMFTEGSAYNPLTTSQSTDAAFTLPFNFPLDITALSETLIVGFHNTPVAQLVVSKSPTRTDTKNRVIHIKFENVPFAAFDNQHVLFRDFLSATTTTESQTLQLSGSSEADAMTAVGSLTLKGINFSVESSIAGLQGLNARPVEVTALDVNHGFPEFLSIKVESMLFNPSNLTIGTGDVAFSLLFQGKTIGVAAINNLVITPGNRHYSIDVRYAPQGDAVTAGRTLLQDFLQGVDVDTTIQGTSSSTSIDSLRDALSQIRLTPVVIPALRQTLIKSASLTFPINIVQTGMASTSFVLANPFTASINLLRVSATAAFHGIVLGKIDNVDMSSDPIHAAGHSSVVSPSLPLKFNLRAISIIQLLTIASQQNGVDLGPLDQLFQFVVQNPDFHPPVTTTVDTGQPLCVSGKQFDAAGAILKSLANLKVDLAIDSSVRLDDFPTDLSFDQNDVLTITDRTALFLVGAVAGPVAQHLVDGSNLEFREANITNISDDGFDLSLAGSLTNIGPLDALITFVEPLTVAWRGDNIGQIALSPICAAANSGVPDYRTNARFRITNLPLFTAFATFLLHNPNFDWTVSTSKLRLTALGTIFDNVSLSKVVTLKAFNGLPGVTIRNFQLPSDDPLGGIHIETDALIPSSAQLGIDLGTVTFNTFFRDVLIGPLSGHNLFLAGNRVTQTHLNGRILPKGNDELNNIGVLFSNFLTGENQTLVTKGDSVQPSGSDGPVRWLSDAFKTLTLNVILPGEKLDVIKSITINDLSVIMNQQSQALAPPTSSNSTLAGYQNPFGFSLQVTEAGQNIVLNSHGLDIAQLTVPKEPVNGGVSTGNIADLLISFHDQPLKSINDAAFAQMFAAVTLTDKIDLVLKGSADVSAKTTIGSIPINGIPFNVPSRLEGINSFGHMAVLSDVSVTGSGGHGGNEFIVSPLTTTLENPSNVSLDTVDVSLVVIFKDVKIGRAVISKLNLRPGKNAVATEFHYQPDTANDTVAQSFLSEFIQTGNDINLAIRGDQSSSPFQSLGVGLANLQLTTSLTGLNQPTFITHISVTITLDTLVTNLVSVNFDVHNPLDADLVLELVQSDSGLDGITYAQFSQGFSSFVVPPGQTVNSGDFGNVLLTQGALASLDIIPRGVLDVAAASMVRIGKGGYQIPWLHLSQTNVPTSYNLALKLSAMREKAKEAKPSASTSSSTSTIISDLPASTQHVDSSSTVAGSIATSLSTVLSQNANISSVLV